METIGVNEQAIAALKTLRSEVNSLHKDLLTGTKNLITAYAENEQGLGAHSQAIQSIIDDLNGNAESGSKPVKRLVRKLKVSEDVRQIHRNTNEYKITRH